MLTRAKDIHEADSSNSDSGTYVVSEHLRLMGDLTLQLLAPIDVTESKIRVAHGALYNLKGTLPSDVLDKNFVKRTSFSGPEQKKDAAV